MNNKLVDTEREKYVKNFMEREFVPKLHDLLKTANPFQYEKWGGNACRQTAIFGVKFLEKLLPTYLWEAWDGDFNDVVNGRKVQYNHAWIYGIDKSNNRKLLVDLSRLYHERLFLFVEDNKYPKDHPSYLYMNELKREKMDIKECMKDLEFYTSERSTKVLEDLKVKTNFEIFKKALKKI
jgi:hypothetical protein